MKVPKNLTGNITTVKYDVDSSGQAATQEHRE